LQDAFGGEGRERLEVTFCDFKNAIRCRTLCGGLQLAIND